MSKVFITDYGIDEVSDTTLAMILNISRGISEYNSSLLCNLYSNWHGTYKKTIKRNSNIVLGVIGAGRIGSKVILKANYLKYITVFFDPYKERGYEKILSSKRMESLDDLIRISDIITFHVPLNDETKGILDKHFILKMKNGALIVNTSRGKIINDLGLIYEALKNNKISCIALDVLPEEPPRENKLFKAWMNREKWIAGRVIINPHTAFYSKQSFKEMRISAALNALNILNGKSPINIVNGKSI